MTPEVFSAMGRRAYKEIEKRILEKTGASTIEEYKQDSAIGEIAEDFYGIIAKYNDKLPQFSALFLDAASLMFIEWVGKTKGIDNPKKYLEEMGGLKASELALEYATEEEEEE